MVEFLKIWVFLGIWNLIQIFLNLFDTGNLICTMTFIQEKNKFIPYIHQEVMFMVHLFICLCVQKHLFQSATGANLLSHGLKFAKATKTRALFHKRERYCFLQIKNKVYLWVLMIL